MKHLAITLCLTTAITLGGVKAASGKQLITECSPKILKKIDLAEITKKERGTFRTENGTAIRWGSKIPDYVKIFNRTALKPSVLITFFWYEANITPEVRLESPGILFRHGRNISGVCFGPYNTTPEAILIERRPFHKPLINPGWERHLSFSTMSVTSCGSGCWTTSVETLSFDPEGKSYFWGTEIKGSMGYSQWFFDRLSLEEARSIANDAPFIWQGKTYN